MQCSMHDESPAIGICPNCGRGVCRRCSPGAVGLLACSPVCAEAASQLRKSVEIILLKSQRAALVSAWFCWLSGLVFLIFGLIESLRGHGPIHLFLIFSGFIFVAVGFAYAKSSKRGR